MTKSIQAAPIESDVEVCILAGGLSMRMGRDKARLRLGRRTLLGHVRANALQLGSPVRVLRRDLVSRCGPLGGIYSALRTTRHEAVLFLACDMPLVSPKLLRSLLEQFNGTRPVFAVATNRPGFPLVLPTIFLPEVGRLLCQGKLSLHNLAGVTKARLVRVARSALLNVNTPSDFALARRVMAREQG